MLSLCLCVFPPCLKNCGLLVIDNGLGTFFCCNLWTNCLKGENLYLHHKYLQCPVSTTNMFPPQEMLSELIKVKNTKRHKLTVNISQQSQSSRCWWKACAIWNLFSEAPGTSDPRHTRLSTSLVGMTPQMTCCCFLTQNCISDLQWFTQPLRRPSHLPTPTNAVQLLVAMDKAMKRSSTSFV